MFLEALVAALQFGLTVLGLALCIGLFWHMRRIGKPVIANVWWLLSFVLPLPFLAVELTAQPTVNSLVFAGAMAVWLLTGIAIRFFNPLQDASRAAGG